MEGWNEKDVVAFLELIIGFALKLPVRIINEDQDPRPTANKLAEVGLVPDQVAYTESSSTKSSFLGSFIRVSHK